MNRRNLVGAAIVILLALVPLFGHLTELPIQRWDESRLAVTAYEMTQNNNWLVPYHNGHPEMYSIKPPLQIWFMAVSIKLFGANELAVRLPSAIFALLTCLFIYWFLTVKMRNRTQAIIAAAVLIASEGYVRLHGTRTGDYESLLTLLTTVFLLYGYLYLREGKGKYIFISALALTLAGFTKGVAPLMFLPAVCIYFGYRAALKKVFTSPAFYAGVGVFILVLPGYYLLREQLTPGYIELLYKNEWGGRFLDTIEGHHHPGYFYIKKFIEWDILWLFLAMLSVPFFPIYKTKETSQLVLYLATTTCGYTIVISAAGTKLDWYSMPVYPLLAIMSAITIETASSRLIQLPGATWVSRTTLVVVISLVYASSYSSVLAKVLKPDYGLHDKEYAIGYYLTQVHKGNKGTSKFILLNSDYAQDMVWYDLIDSNMFFKSVKDLSGGDTVVAYRDESIAAIEDLYHNTLLEEFYHIQLYKIDSLKATTTPQ